VYVKQEVCPASLSSHGLIEVIFMLMEEKMELQSQLQQGHI
jgi:hypothetical protein